MEMGLSRWRQEKDDDPKWFPENVNKAPGIAT
jgi:hypothetical protein